MSKSQINLGAVAVLPFCAILLACKKSGPGEKRFSVEEVRGLIAGVEFRSSEGGSVRFDGDIARFSNLPIGSGSGGGRSGEGSGSYRIEFYGGNPRQDQPTVMVYPNDERYVFMFGFVDCQGVPGLVIDLDLFSGSEEVYVGTTVEGGSR